MNFNEYQEAVVDMPLYDNPLLGLVGEVGEVVELIKKDMREGERRKPLHRGDLTYELGDVLWYLARLADEYDINLDNIARLNIEKLNKRHAG